MITYAIQDWYRDDNDELVSEDTGYIVEWDTDNDKLTTGTSGVIYDAVTGERFTGVTYFSNHMAPFMNNRNAILYDSLAYLVEKQIYEFDQMVQSALNDPELQSAITALNTVFAS